MAPSAWVDAEMSCPKCGAVLSDCYWLAWGGVLSADARDGPVYRIGSRLLWFVDEQGVAPADTAWRSSRGTNLGDPRISDVDVVTGNAPSHCRSCGCEIYGGVVAIRGGVIVGARAVVPGEVTPNVDAIVLDPVSGEAVEELSSQAVREL